MTYSLSTSVIIDTIHALAAAGVLVGDCDRGRPVLAPLLDRQRKGLLALLIRNSFAETVMALSPMVSDCSLDRESHSDDPGHQYSDDATDPHALLQVTLMTPPSLPERTHGLIRRTLEQAVARGAVGIWASAMGEMGGAAVIAATMQELMSQSIRNLRTLMRPPVSPYIR